MKVCKKCAVEKELTLFYVCKKGKEGRRAKCKECENADKLVYRNGRKDIKKAYDAEYKREHKEKQREQDKQWLSENSEYKKEYLSDWRKSKVGCPIYSAKNRLRKHKRRTMEKALPYNLTTSDVFEIMEEACA